jgi:hypothetical protein
VANEQVSIFHACRMVGVDTPDFEAGSQKLYCPFGEIYHADGGMGRAFRIYPGTNSAYCFACVRFFSPVSIVALGKDMSLEAAADYLLDDAGWTPPDIDSRWQAAIATMESVDTDYLAEALKVACERMDPLWEIHEFEPGVGATLRQCLDLLSKVRTQEDGAKWLTATKTVMQRALGVHP